MRASGWREDANDAWPGILLGAVIAIASAFIADHRGGPTLLVHGVSGAFGRTEPASDQTVGGW
jgi:hypothetical protein